MNDLDAFVEELARQIAGHLRRRAAEFKAHRLGAVALDAHPWHHGMGLSVLIETDQYRKWDVGDWEHQEFAEIGDPPAIQRGYKTLQDPGARGSRVYAPFFRACARALCHPSVRAALQSYTLEPDFELYVGDPDDPNEANLCEELVGVDRARRKPKAEIVNDLNEALKDPAAVRVLKYWYHDRLTKAADEKIARLTHLEVLYLNSMGLKDLPGCVSSLGHLVELHLDGNRLTRLTGLRSAAPLTMLSLRDNGRLTPEMADEIAAVDSLRVGNCGLTKVPESWRRLHRLEEVYLFGNPLTAIPDWLPALPRVKRLGLVKVVDDAAKDRLRQQHPHLEIW